MPIKILATGDLHLGKKSAAVGDIPAAATKFTWNKIVDWCIKNQVDVLLLTGDIIDHNNRFFEAVGPLEAGFKKLEKNEIQVFIVAGNHDAKVLTDTLLPEKYSNVHLLGRGGNWEITNFEKNGQKLQFIGWSFPDLHHRWSPFLDFPDLPFEPEVPVIGLLHCEVDNAESPYAPVMSSHFLARAVDAWLLGHIHKPEVLKATAPFVAYPGSPQAMSSKETGAHGGLLLNVNSKTDISFETIAFSPVRYETLPVDITEASNETELQNILHTTISEKGNAMLTELNEVKYLIFDIVLFGEHEKINEIPAWTAQATEGYEAEVGQETRIRIRKLSYNLRPKINLERLAHTQSPAGILANNILKLQQGESNSFLDELISKWLSRQKAFKSSKVFSELEEPIADRALAREYVLQESNKLLAQLVNQQS